MQKKKQNKSLQPVLAVIFAWAETDFDASRREIDFALWALAEEQFLCATINWSCTSSFSLPYRYEHAIIKECSFHLTEIVKSFIAFGDVAILRSPQAQTASRYSSLDTWMMISTDGTCITDWVMHIIFAAFRGGDNCAIKWRCIKTAIQKRTEGKYTICVCVGYHRGPMCCVRMRVRACVCVQWKVNFACLCTAAL